MNIPLHFRKYLDQTISDYFYDNSWHFTLSFCSNHWDILVKILLYSVGPSDSDKLIWPPSPSGSCTAKCAYNHLRDKHPTVNWGNWIWSSFIPPRKSIMVWRDKLHIIGPSVCPLCFKSEDNIDHLFVSCAFSHQICHKAFSAFNVIFLNHTSFGELCSYAMRQVFSPQLLSLWRAMFINILWYIWSSRNRYLFENIRPSIWKITASLWADIQETNKLSIGHMFNSQEDLLCLHAIHIIGHRRRPLAFWKFIGICLLLAG